MAKMGRKAGNHRATDDNAVAHLLVVGADDFARAIAAVRAAKDRVPAHARRAPVRPR